MPRLSDKKIARRELWANFACSNAFKIATLEYLVDFAYIEQSTNAVIYRGQRSRKHVVVVGIRCGVRYRSWWRVMV